MTRKQRRAAEYRIMREAENKSSKFITSLNSSSHMGSASTSSRKEAARKAIMGMELPEKIRGRFCFVIVFYTLYPSIHPSKWIDDMD